MSLKIAPKTFIFGFFKKITEIKEDEIMAVAEATAVDTVGNMPFAVTAKDIYAAILAADAIGRTML